MRIAQLAPLEESVPPQGYGGTELIVSLLTDELVDRGHDVTLFASGDSKTKAKLVTVTPHSLRLDKSIPMRRWAAYDLRLLLELQDRQHEFDIVHNHMGYQAFPILAQLACPVISTNHNLVKDYCAPLFLHYKDLAYVAISNAYKSLNYPDKLNYVATIYNGIDISRYTFVPKTKRSFLLFLGRICHDKGTLEAIQIAQALGLPLKIAGKIDQADREYFEKNVQPLLSDKNIEYVGEVDFEKKLSLLSNAIAVVYPITFDEPFGLVMAEALSVGTPVAALDRGAVREIVLDKKTGIVATTKEELISRFSEIAKISSQACRERVEELFSSNHMASEYESLYKKLCSKK